MYVPIFHTCLSKKVKVLTSNYLLRRNAVVIIKGKILIEHDIFIIVLDNII